MPREFLDHFQAVNRLPTRVVQDVESDQPSENVPLCSGHRLKISSRGLFVWIQGQISVDVTYLKYFTFLCGSTIMFHLKQCTEWVAGVRSSIPTYASVDRRSEMFLESRVFGNYSSVLKPRWLFSAPSPDSPLRRSRPRHPRLPPHCRRRPGTPLQVPRRLLLQRRGR